MIAPGYLATITIDSVTYSNFASQASGTFTRDATEKTKLGQARKTYLPTLGDASLSVLCHADSSLYPAIVSAYESKVPVAYVFRPGALAVADLGQYSGEAIVTSMENEAAADSEWNLGIELQGTGDYTYTQPA